ncbi:histidinol-phosphatase [Breznakiella homolactica]|uniref:Histidinol-phosphatase n=1 Tax=Breznakiella homolactica TaxID=2798577 RepID=A0A7T8BAF0_9SPIR|nr:histidinol-phosphatase [Breznakiella homolactica]QQO08945.1 histidinol-phosphatase [Breznakiella homolactica]
MRYSNLHTHSLFCDGTDSIETLCEKAAEKGFEILGFSSHAPLPKTSGLISDWHMPEEKLPEYIDTVRKARQRWNGKLKVFLGLEVDYIRGIMGPADPIYRSLGLDYIIGAVHYVRPPRGEPFTVDGPPRELDRDVASGFGGDGSALMEAYWNALGEMIAAGGFNIIAHLDLIKKNNVGNRYFSPESPLYRSHTDNICRAVARSGLLVEVNTGGWNRGAIAEVYPSGAILAELRREKAPVLINSDAHAHKDLDGHYREAREELLRAGYTGVMRLSENKNGMIEWAEDSL